MKTKTFALLAGILALLALVALLAERSEKSRHTRLAVGKLLPGLDPARASRIEVKSKGEIAVLEKKEGAWKVLPEGVGADAGAVKEALERLARLDRSEIASENPANHQPLEVKGDAATEVQVWSDGTAEGKPPGEGKPTAHLWVGKAGGDFESNFVRLEGEERVYRSKEPVRASFDRPKGWRDRTLLRFAAEDAVKLELVSTEHHVVLERAAAEPAAGWTVVLPAPGPASASAVDTILRTLSQLQADEFSAVSDPAGTGLDVPAARSKIDLKDGRSLEVLWGKEATSGRVYAQVAGQDTVVELYNYRKTSVFPDPDELRADVADELAEDVADAVADEEPAGEADPAAAPLPEPASTP